MIAPLIPILTTLATSAYQKYQGDKQKKLAGKIKPSNYIPPSVQEAVAGARIDANASVAPGYGRTVDKLRTSSANTIARTMRGTKNAGTIQQSVADADAREKEVLKDLEVANEGYRANAKGRLNQTLGVQAGHERASFENYNQAKSALIGSSLQNKFNAFNGLTENLMNLYALDVGGKNTGALNFLNRRRGVKPNPVTTIDNSAEWFSGFNA